MKEIINSREEIKKDPEVLFENIVNGEFSKEFKIMEIEERFKHISGKFLLVGGTKDDIDQMESAFDEYEIDTLRWDGNKIETPSKEGLPNPSFDWKGQYLFIPSNTKVDISDEGNYLVVNCSVPSK